MINFWCLEFHFGHMVTDMKLFWNGAACDIFLFYLHLFVGKLVGCLQQNWLKLNAAVAFLIEFAQVFSEMHKRQLKLTTNNRLRDENFQIPPKLGFWSERFVERSNILLAPCVTWTLLTLHCVWKSGPTTWNMNTHWIRIRIFELNHNPWSWSC